MSAPTNSIADARAKGHMLFCRYQAIWFTPDELEAKNADGKFRWSDENWQVRPPEDYLAQHLRTLESAQVQYDNALLRVASMRKV